MLVNDSQQFCTMLTASEGLRVSRALKINLMSPVCLAAFF